MPRVTDNVKGRPLTIRIDEDNRGWIKAKATTAVVANYAYRIMADDNGWASGGLAMTATTSLKSYWVGIPNESISTGVVGEFQVMGYHEGLLGTTHLGTTGYDICAYSTGSIIALAGFSGHPGAFAVCRATSTLSSTSHKMYMLGRHITYPAT